MYIAGCYDAMEAASERSYHHPTWISPPRRILIDLLLTVYEFGSNYWIFKIDNMTIRKTREQHETSFR